MTGLVVGAEVRAFHPAMLGVVKTARVVAIGRKYARLDFGALLGGTWRVRFADIVERVS